MSLSRYRRVHTMMIPTHLYELCEGGKAHLGVSNVEYCVVALHKGLPQDPVRHFFLLHNGTKVSIRVIILSNEVEIREGEFPATDVEGMEGIGASQGKSQ
jgi:hypothetical protein